MICPNCGENVPENVKFCRSCGSPMPQNIQNAGSPGYSNATVYADSTSSQQSYQPQGEQYTQPQYGQPQPFEQPQPQQQYQPYNAQPQYGQNYPPQYDQPYSQPYPQYDQQGSYGQTKSKPPVMIIVIIIVLIGVIIGLIVALASRGGDDDDDDSKASKKGASDSRSADDDDDDDDDDFGGGGGKIDIDGGSTASKYVGTWKSTTWLYDGNMYTADDPTYGSVVSSMMILKLNSDGTGSYTMAESSGTCNWTAYDNGIVIDDGYDEIQMSLSGSQLVFTVEESTVYLSKVS